MYFLIDFFSYNFKPKAKPLETIYMPLPSHFMPHKTLYKLASFKKLNNIINRFILMNLFVSRMIENYLYEYKKFRIFFKTQVENSSTKSKL